VGSGQHQTPYSRVAYVALLVLDTGGHAAYADLAGALRWFIIPLTVLTLAVSLARHLRSP